MAFEKVVPEWGAAGSEPPASLKSGGFTAGYKPPAQYFNWFFNRTSEALEELQAKGMNAHGASTDLNTELSVGASKLIFSAWSAETLNTPTKQGATNSASGFALTFASTSDGIQIAFTAASREMFLRSKSGGTISQWVQMYSPDHKPTPDDIGLPTGNIATYNDISQIGLTAGSETIETIAASLPSNSMLYYTVSSTSNVSQFPYSNYGLLVVDKTVSSRVMFEFSNSQGRKWIGMYNKTTSGTTWTGWCSVYSDSAPMVLTQYQHYGNSLPDPGTAGRIFFKKV